MDAELLLLNLLGSVALLLWATRMVRTGVLRAFGGDLRRAVGRATVNRLRACLIGVAMAAALQSSTATALLSVSFAARGLLAVSPGLAIMLGADVGSTLVVQILSFDISAIIPLAFLGGVAAFMIGQSALVRQLGRVAIGLGLVILSLGMIVGASEPLRESRGLVTILELMAGEPFLAMLLAALLTWLAHSSVAIVLLIVSLAMAGVVPPSLGLVLVLGANIGAGLVPLGLTLRSAPEARRIPVGNLVFRTLGALAVLPFIGLLAPLVAQIEADPARQMANFHTAFNLALVLVFLPLTGVAARLLERLLPQGPVPEDDARPRYLDEANVDRPAVAIASATREVMRLADLVETMLRKVMVTFARDDEKEIQELSNLDDQVDRLHEAIKMYLARASRSPMSDEEAQRTLQIVTFTTNLEHIGDIIDKSLLELANKRRRNRLAFSAQGWQELQDLHRRVCDQMQLAMTVFVTQDIEMARQLIADKERIRDMERVAGEAHLNRLRSGLAESIETSALHLDILRDLKRINSHLSAVAYPILEAEGELRDSRLRVRPRQSGEQDGERARPFGSRS